MPDDAAQTILAPAQIDNGLKADAWEAFNGSTNERELGAKLQGMNLPDKVKADLWEAKRGMAQPKQLPIPNAVSQARQTVSNIIKPMVPGTNIVDPTQGRMAAAQAGQDPNYNEYMRQSGIQAGITAATMGAGALVPQVAGTGLAARGANLGLRATGTGAASAVGGLAGGATPDEAKVLGVTGAASQPVAEGISSIASKVPALTKWMMSSKTQGAQLLEQASQKAGNAPVAISPATDKIVEQITKESSLGGPTVPKVITDFLKRVGPTVKNSPFEEAPLTYDEARILQSNASALSAQEQMNIKGTKMNALVKQFAKSFSQDVQNAADTAGVGAEHAAGMKEFALASARNRTLTKAAKYALPTAGGLGLMYELLRGIKR